MELITVGGTQRTTVDPGYPGGNYVWSPTGDRLVGTVHQKEPNLVGFAVIDAATGAATKHWIDGNQFDCSTCAFSWTRDGREIVMAIADRSGGRAPRR